MNRAEQYCQTIKNLCTTDSGESVVPTEYRQVAYLENTGEEYIITTIRPHKAMITEISFSLGSNPDYTQAYLFGVRSTGGSVWGTNYWTRLNSDSSLQVVNGVNDTAINNITLLSGVNELYYTSGQIKLNDTEIGTQTTTIDYDYGKPVINLWCRSNYNKNTVSSTTISSGGLRIHGVKFTYNGDLVGDMYPCYRKSDKKPGMYDLVTETFLTNAGTGDFTVGPAI